MLPPLTGKLRPKPENIGPMALRSKEPAPEERGDVKFLHVGLLLIEHAPPLFVRIREDKISLKISPAPLRYSSRHKNFIDSKKSRLGVHPAFLSGISVKREATRSRPRPWHPGCCEG